MILSFILTPPPYPAAALFYGHDAQQIEDLATDSSATKDKVRNVYHQMVQLESSSSSKSSKPSGSRSNRGGSSGSSSKSSKDFEGVVLASSKSSSSGSGGSRRSGGSGSSSGSKSSKDFEGVEVRLATEQQHKELPEFFPDSLTEEQLADWDENYLEWDDDRNDNRNNNGNQKKNSSQKRQDQRDKRRAVDNPNRSQQEVSI